jgi:predicted TIM-barrel fold metal-dependent hydrolase
MIDIHTHLHPPKLFRAIRRWFAEHSSWKLTQPTEPSEVAASLKTFDVERFVFCSYAHKPGIAEGINNWLVQTSRDLGRYGLPLATVHLADADCAQYYERALDEGCIGIKIHEDVQRLSIDDPRFAPVHDLTARRGRFILVHVGPIPWQTDTNNGPARIKKVLDRHPGLRIVVAHLGIPDTREYLELSRDYPNLYIDTTMALTKNSPLYHAVEPDLFEKHAANILYGSDYPNLPHPYEAESQGVKDLPISDQAKRLILAENARKFLAADL